MKEKSGKGYVAHVFSISAQYGNVDTENLIHIGNDGTIKNIKKLTWSVSEAVPEWGYIPPSEEALGEFYDGLIGKNSASIEEVDLKTGATNTTVTLVDSIKEALAAVNALNENDVSATVDNTPKTVGIAVLVLSAVAVAAYIAVPKIMRRRKNG